MVSDDVSPAYLLARASDALDAPDPWVHGFAVVHRETARSSEAPGSRDHPTRTEWSRSPMASYPIHQGQGFATEAAAALVAFAVGSSKVRVLRAHTLPTANASTRVLAKCGFAHTGEIVDPEDGPVWRWEQLSPTKG